MLPTLVNYEHSCYKHPRAGFCVDMFSNHFDDTKERDCWIVYCEFVRNCQLSPKAAVSSWIPTSNERPLPLLISSSTLSVVGAGYLTLHGGLAVVFICICLMVW
jgi:hypothetical protein